MFSLSQRVLGLRSLEHVTKYSICIEIIIVFLWLSRHYIDYIHLNCPDSIKSIILIAAVSQVLAVQRAGYRGMSAQLVICRYAGVDRELWGPLGGCGRTHVLSSIKSRIVIDESFLLGWTWHVVAGAGHVVAAGHVEMVRTDGMTWTWRHLDRCHDWRHVVMVRT